MARLVARKASDLMKEVKHREEVKMELNKLLRKFKIKSKRVPKNYLFFIALYFAKWQEMRDEKEIKNQYTLGEQAGREEVLYELEKGK